MANGVVVHNCSYPKYTPVPFEEEEFWNGYPEETNAPYGLAKKMLLVQAQAYREQYEMNTIYLIPVNLYGPGDGFKPESSHVIPAMIKKIGNAMDRGESIVTLWGSGRASREFLYVEDCAKGICNGLEKYDDKYPVNLGSGQEITIKMLAELIGRLMNFKGEFKWDISQPDGQPCRSLNVDRAKDYLDWRSEVSLREGLIFTIDWWKKHAR